MKGGEAEKGASSFMMSALSFHESCHPSQLINFSASPWTSWIIFDSFTFHHRALCHLDCSSRSELLEGSFLLFFHLANRTSGNAKSEWTPVSYLQNNMGHFGAVKCLCYCFSLVAVKLYSALYLFISLPVESPYLQLHNKGFEENRSCYLTQNATKSQKSWQSFAEMCSRCPAIFRPVAA